MAAKTRERSRTLLALLVVAAARAAAEQQQAGSAIAEPVRDRRIVVSIPDRKLALVEDGRVVKVYATAVGAARTPSPSGTYSVKNRLVDPTWYHKGAVVKPGKANPLGTRWIGLSLGGYGIHGTNRPQSIGRNASHGCIRMRNQDVEELFERVQVGDVVELHGERTPLLAWVFGETVTLASLGGGQ